MSPEQIATYRRKYGELVEMMDQPGSWDRETMLACVGKAFGGVKVIPMLLDEIERLQDAARQPQEQP